MRFSMDHSEGDEHRVRMKDAKDFWPKEWSGDSKSRAFRRFTSDLEMFLDTLLPSMDSKGLIQWIAKQSGKLVPEDKLGDAAVAAGVPLATLKEVSNAMGAVLHKQCSECTKIQNVHKKDGISVYRTLVHHYSAQSAMDSCTLLARIAAPGRAGSINGLADKLEAWDDWVTEYELKFDPSCLTDAIKMTAMMNLLPSKTIEDKVYGCGKGTYEALRELAEDITADIRQFGNAKKTGELDSVRKGNLAEMAEATVQSEDDENLDQFGKGGKGGNGKGQWGRQGGWSKGGGGTYGGKDGGWKGGAAGGWKGGGKQMGTRECYGCGQKGHIARDCPAGGGKGGWKGGKDGGKSGGGKAGGGKGDGKGGKGGKGNRRDRSPAITAAGSDTTGPSACHDRGGPGQEGEDGTASGDCRDSKGTESMLMTIVNARKESMPTSTTPRSLTSTRSTSGS